MRIEIPRPAPRETGDYGVWVTPGYGDPRGTIHLAENGILDLRDLSADDCDRLIRAACKAREEILRYQAEMAAPHGRKRVYQGTCQLCGKAEDDELHADPVRQALITLACSHEFTGPVTGVKVAHCVTCDRAESIVRIDGQDPDWVTAGAPVLRGARIGGQQ